MSKKSDAEIPRLLATVAVLCMMVLTAVVVRREFFPRQMPDDATVKPQLLPPIPVQDWTGLRGKGHRIGPDTSKVTVVVFSDFECPSCGRFATFVMPALRQRYPGQISLIFRHWPLTIHRRAYAAARASECAAAQGRFQAFHDLVFAQQDSLGSKTFRQFANDAAVPDLADFDRCNTSKGPLPVVETDIAEARRLKARGTPTIIVNGMQIQGPYNVASLAEVIDKTLGAKPQ